MRFNEYCPYKIKIEEMLSAEFLLKPAFAVMLKNEKSQDIENLLSFLDKNNVIKLERIIKN